MDPSEIVQLRSDIQGQINNYSNQEVLRYQVTLQHSEDNAKDGINGVINNYQDERIRNLELAVSKIGNESTRPLILDIALTIVFNIAMPNVVGHLAQLALNRFIRSRISKVEAQLPITRNDFSANVWSRIQNEMEFHREEAKQVKNIGNNDIPFLSFFLE